MLRLSTAFERHAESPTAQTKRAVGLTVRVAIESGVSRQDIAQFTRLTVAEIDERAEW